MKNTGSLSLADLIQTFFRRDLIATWGVSPHTLHAYRDAIGGLLTFAAARCSRSVVELSVDDLSGAKRSSDFSIISNSSAGIPPRHAMHDWRPFTRCSGLSRWKIRVR